MRQQTQPRSGARSNVAVNTAERSRLTMEAAVKRVAKSGPSLVAIDGLPCSGKSTMAELLKQRLSASCVQLDEFLLPERDWPADVKPAFPFQYIRYSAFVSAVQALATAGSCSFEPFDWNSYEVASEPRTVTLEVPVIVEGVSSLNPVLSDLFDVRIFVESDRSTTLQAAMERGVGPWARQWRELFLPSADLYMATEPRNRADVLVAGRGA